MNDESAVGREKAEDETGSDADAVKGNTSLVAGARVLPIAVI